MTRRLAYAIVVLFVLGATPGWVGLFWNLHNEHAARVAEQRAGAVFERRLCSDLATMAGIRPPGGSPVANPSRAYEQAEHRAWQGLVLAIECKEKP